MNLKVAKKPAGLRTVKEAAAKTPSRRGTRDPKLKLAKKPAGQPAQIEQERLAAAAEPELKPAQTKDTSEDSAEPEPEQDEADPLQYCATCKLPQLPQLRAAGAGPRNCRGAATCKACGSYN